MEARERNDLIISWITISLAFAVMIIPSLFGVYPLFLSIFIAFFAVGTGFVFHELAHRFVARKFGLHAEFVAWKTGLLIALALPVITLLIFNNPVLFAAPGAVYIFGNSLSNKQNGLISASGPASNIAFSILFFVLAFFFNSSLIGVIFYYTAQINAFLAFFNLLPLFVLDGTKVMQWSIPIWAAMIILAAILAFAI
jgi:Zn-dependent protease